MNNNVKMILGDSLEELKKIEDNSIDSIVTDPPYHLVSIVKRFGKKGSAPAQYGKDGSFGRLSKGFMGKEWDGVDENGIGIAYNVDLWAECLRVLKPGGHLLAFSGTRTYHRMAIAIEDAGFEVRDMIEWVYGSGFPKSLNIGKAIDKRGGESIGCFGEWLKEWREQNNIPQSKIAELFPSKTGGLTGCVSNWELGNNLPTNEQFNLICETFDLPFKLLEEAEREFLGTKTSGIGKAFTKDGWGSGHDEVEITKGTSKWEGWGTALKPAHEPICMARKPLAEKTVAENVLKYGTGGINIDESRVKMIDREAYEAKQRTFKGATGKVGEASWKNSSPLNDPETSIENSKLGRFPANLIHDNSDEVRECFPETGKGNGKGVYNYNGTEYNNKDTSMFNGDKPQAPSNFNDSGSASRFFKSIIYNPKASKAERNKGLPEGEKNIHPTLKPIALMEYLIKMVTPKGGTVLDPFMGSGSTGVACAKNNYSFIGIEKEKEYFGIAENRIKNT